MTSSPETRLSLVLRLRNARDQAAWTEFLALYEPLLLRLFHRNGLQESDALDLCQQVLEAVARDVADWKPDAKNASFRRWLSAVARNRVLKFFARQRHGARAQGGTDALLLLAAIPDDDASATAAFDREYQNQLLLSASQQIRNEFREPTWEAFWRTCVDGRAAAEVAAELGMTIGNVYVARSRIIARLRDRVTEMRSELDDD